MHRQILAAVTTTPTTAATLIILLLRRAFGWCGGAEERMALRFGLGTITRRHPVGANFNLPRMPLGFAIVSARSMRCYVGSPKTRSANKSAALYLLGLGAGALWLHGPRVYTNIREDIVGVEPWRPKCGRNVLSAAGLIKNVDFCGKSRARRFNGNHCQSRYPGWLSMCSRYIYIYTSI